MNPINTFGLFNTRRRAVQVPEWADDAIHYEAPETPTLQTDPTQTEQPQPSQAALPPVRRAGLYRSALKKHDAAVRDIQRQAEQAANT